MNEQTVRLTVGEGREKQYLHFSGRLWIKNPAYAWIGTLDQLRAVTADPEFTRISDARMRAEIHKRR